MKVLYLTNPHSEFGDFIPKALSVQNVEVTTHKDQIKDVHRFDADYIVSDRYSKKIPAYVCDEYIDRSLNLHSSLLPLFRGSYPVLFSILHGEIPGWSIHRITSIIDKGEVLFQKKICLDFDTDTLRTAWLRCQLEMMTHLVTNFIYFAKANRFPGFQAISSGHGGQFYFRKNFESVKDLLTQGWETPVSQIFGLHR